MWEKKEEKKKRGIPGIVVLPKGTWVSEVVLREEIVVAARVLHNGMVVREKGTVDWRESAKKKKVKKRTRKG